MAQGVRHRWAADGLARRPRGRWRWPVRQLSGVELFPVVRVASRALAHSVRVAVVAALVVVARLGVSAYGGWWIWCQPSGRLNPRHALGRVALPRYWLPPVPRLIPALRTCLVRGEADARRVHRFVPLGGCATPLLRGHSRTRPHSTWATGRRAPRRRGARHHAGTADRSGTATRASYRVDCLTLDPA
jgi:hypothetical protein